MAFIDELTIHASAGKGGDGVVRWRREKFIARGGPAGGDGGRGGDVYAQAVRDINILSHYRFKKRLKAENGEKGRSKNQHGHNGEDLVIKVPVGSVIVNLKTRKEYELLDDGERVLLLRGGEGGYGNTHFKSPTNRAPRQWTPGKPGEEADFYIELRLIADVGLVGLPNAGKSTLLNELTKAQAKIGAYPFTTLEPNLGVLPGGYIAADIPGLIEGASEGKGLGIKFLRHIKRTRILAHLISLENEDLMETYKAIRRELELYDPALIEKEEVIVLTKADIVDQKTIKETIKSFKVNCQRSQPKAGPPQAENVKCKIFAVSVCDDKSLKNLQDGLIKLLRRKP